MSTAVKYMPVTIPSGQSLSNGALLGDYSLCGLLFPAVWTAAGLTYQISFDGGTTFVNLNDSTGTEVALPASPAAGKYFAIDPFNSSLTGITLLKLRSGTAAAPVNQAQDTTVIVVGRRIYSGP